MAAAGLPDGDVHVPSRLGIETQTGDRHDRMDTHNNTPRLGAADYIEVIAVNPDAATPQVARWFDFDGADRRALLV